VKARAPIESSTYDPKTLKVMAQAFDAAWECVKHNFDNDEIQAAEARECLTHAILALTNEATPDADALKSKALRVLALSYHKPLATSQG
jgi:hypothetical protein